MEGDDSDAYEQVEYNRDQARPGLMPSAQDYETIGHLYEAIRQNLHALSHRFGDEGLFIGGRCDQLGRDVVDLTGMATIGSLAEALAAVDLIVEQGEGSSADREDSHYRSFYNVRDELEKLSAANPDFRPAWPVADNPVLRQPPEPEDKVFIGNPEAAKLLDFACATYGLLVRILSQSFARSGSQALSDQQTLLAVSFELMHVMGAAATSLARLPASEDRDDIHAGMSFTMLRGVEPLLGGAAETRIVREQLSELGNSGLPAELTERLKTLSSNFQLSQEGSAIS
jgi:hypothetical protein